MTSPFSTVRKHIFKDDKIMTQELSITDDRKVLALCDLSDSQNVVEIKTKDVLDEENNITQSLARQLFYQAKGRNTYALSIKFDVYPVRINDDLTIEVVDSLIFYLYKVELSVIDPATIVKTKTLNVNEISMLKEIIKCPSISKTELSNKLGCTAKCMSFKGDLYNLQLLEYIKKENPSDKASPWIVLRSLDDITTRYTWDGKEFHIIEKGAKDHGLNSEFCG